MSISICLEVPIVFLIKLNNAKKYEEPKSVFLKLTLSYPLYELIDKYSKQFVRTRF